MGTGKSTLGKYIANQKSLTFIDLDDYIVGKTSQNIPEIFETRGEEAFRKLEYEALQETMSKYDIIATGGGIVEYAPSFALLDNAKSVIWVDCDFDTIFSRIKNDKNRPNAKNKSFVELKNLYSKRVSRYNEIAFKKVNSIQTVEVLSDEIFQLLDCE
ncbi:shikimate kinase [Staphylococcus auricularis]|uniref:shikimate kinase n=1 Tax=Staphylococcus auricularis TaxID=29379 RepID=UPI003EB83938